MNDSPLPLGKLRVDFLEKILPTNLDPSVVVGPKVGEDATVIDFGSTYLVITTDPITFATDEIGWYVVCVNSNDLATMGATPKWLQVTILLPENKTTEKLVRDIMDQITKACQHFNISLCGGHTEVTYGLDRPIVIGQMLGEVAKDKLIISSSAQEGDDLILTKGLGIEATSIIARERESDLLKNFSPERVTQARKYLTDPGISVLKEASIAINTGGVHAMHDPTEGGISTAIHELAHAANVGAMIWEDKLLISDITKSLCQEFGIDPLGAISSGALLIAADHDKSDQILLALAEQEIPSTIIGQLLNPEDGIQLKRKDGQNQQLPIFETDEITKIF